MAKLYSRADRKPSTVVTHMTVRACEYGHEMLELSRGMVHCGFLLVRDGDGAKLAAMLGLAEAKAIGGDEHGEEGQGR